MVFDHIGFNVSNFAQTKEFLSKALQPLGIVVPKTAKVGR